MRFFQYKKRTLRDLALVWDRLPTADPGGPATISSQAYAYYMQNVLFCIFVPTAHDDLSLASHFLEVSEIKSQSI